MNKNSGLTLIELMIAMAIAGIVMSVIFLSYQAQIHGQVGQQATLDMQQAARAGLEVIASDLRIAGCDPNDVAGAGAGASFVTAAANVVRVTMDIRGGGSSLNESDGVLDEPGEDVRYALVNGNLIRERVGFDTAGVGVPLVRNVDALNFVYLDADGIPTGTLGDIRSVEVALLVRSEETAMMRTWADNRAYVNQQGDVIFQANDDNRRLLLTTTINCRNM